LVGGFERELGRWDLAAADRLLKSKASWGEVEREVERMAGPRGLMIFTRINQGEIISLAGASHTREQVTHFGPDGLMRRHDYTVDVLGGATGANYSTNYREYQGIKVPTTRRVYAYDASGQKVPEPLLVSIDIRSISFL
jgi:hypothetical protein